MASPSPDSGSAPLEKLLGPEMLNLQRQLDALDSSSDEDGGPEKIGRPSTSGKPAAVRDGVSPQSDHNDEEDEDEDMLRPRGRMAAGILYRHDGKKKKADMPIFETAGESVRRVTELGRKLGIPDDSGTSEQDDEDEDEDIVRPRARAQKKKEDVPIAETAGESVKRMAELAKKLGIPEDWGTAEQDDGDEDEEVVKPRRRKTKNPGRAGDGRRVERAAQEDAADEEEEEIVQPRQREAKSRQERSTTPASAITFEDTAASPGLFVSPHGQDQDERMEALLAKKKSERLAREAAQEKKRAVRCRNAVSDDETSDGERKLTKHTRPAARKASKKALEEMERETQRMSRSMQLAHEAMTRTKVSKSTLLEKFNFKPAARKPAVPRTDVQHSSSRPQTPTSGLHSDGDVKNAQTTPPSSPPTAGTCAPPDHGPMVTNSDDEENLPSLDEVLTNAVAAKRRAAKGKGKATAADLEAEDRALQSLSQPKRKLRVKLPATLGADLDHDDDDDDDLRIQFTRKNKLDAIFASVPACQDNESRVSQLQRRLAQLDDPEKRAVVPKGHNGPSMTTGELQNYLHQQARLQAKAERERRVEALRARGVEVLTAEERAKELSQVDDMVARARQEAEEIMARERDLAKKEKKEKRASGALDPLAFDSSDDESYCESQDEGGNEEPETIELSGSEDESEQAEDDEEETGLVEQVDAAEDVSVAASSDHVPAAVGATPRAQPTTTTTTTTTHSPAVPDTVLRSAHKTFIPGLPVAGPAGLGLTQIFAGTMDDNSQVMGSGTTQEWPKPTFEMPDANFSQTVDAGDEGDMVLDSQPHETQDRESQGGVRLGFSQSQVHGFDSLLRADLDMTQVSDMLEPTQDAGFRDFTPIARRFVEVAEPSPTVSTMPSDDATQAMADDEPEADAADAADAFDVLQHAATRERKRRARGKVFDKKKSKAREMVEDQAQESEDEYAGLGGADGDDDSEDDAASVEDMIDDETRDTEGDDRKLAAFYADRERASAEQQVEKLFFDITKGMLRRKRGVGASGFDDDLSDVDDGGEARRRLKRRRFARLQRTLFADERISKVAENPLNQAFLRTIEDVGSDDEMDFIMARPPLPTAKASVDTQKKPQVPRTVPDTQRQHRPAHIGRPTSLSETRESLAGLLADPSDTSVIPATQLGSDDDDDEDEGDDKEIRNPRRSEAVIDRIALKRNSSSTLSTSSSSSRRLAFAVPSSSAAVFRVPALLRRATTNSLSSASACTTPTGHASTSGDAVMKKAGRRSGVSYLAGGEQRAAAAAVAESERRREARKAKGAVGRAKAVGGLLKAGTFE